MPLAVNLEIAQKLQQFVTDRKDAKQLLVTITGAIFIVNAISVTY
jgi:hypothetical protein